MISLNTLNRHWKKGFYYNFKKKRDLYKKVESYLAKKYIVSIVGLRRTGKTTIMKQLIDTLIKKGVPRKNILIYSFDSPAELEEVLDTYEKISGTSIDTGQRYLFLDEVQKLENWQDKIKIYYDNYPKLKIILSGSSSVFIRKKSESLAGRILEFELNPLSFKEFLYFNNKESLLKDVKLFSNELRKQFEMYLFRQFIEILQEDKETIQEYVNSLVKKICFEDIPSVYPVEQPQVLLKILQMIASSPGMLIDYKNLSSDLGINEKTLSNYFEFMEKAYLLHKSYNFSRNFLTSEKKLKKAYLKTTSFCTIEPINTTKLVENCVITQINSKFFWRRTHEVDCIIQQNKQVVPIEIKYKDHIKQKELKGITMFIEKFNTNKGIVLTKSIEKKKGKIQFIPTWKFLLNF